MNINLVESIFVRSFLLILKTKISFSLYNNLKFANRSIIDEKKNFNVLIIPSTRSLYSRKTWTS